jgi:hypothetical protein
VTRDYSALKARIRERYPQGLTGIFSVGATRTSFILEHNRENENPGEITDFNAYVRYGIDSSLRFLNMFFEMGGSHALATIASFQILEDKRGPHYPELAAQQSQLLYDGSAQEFYRQHQIDPYFTGIDILLLRPEGSPQHRMAKAVVAFQKTWDYQPDHHRLVWEIAPMPLYTFRLVDELMGEAARLEFDEKLEQALGNYNQMYQLLYDYYATAAYGTPVPAPQFYLASNRNGDMKPRAFLPFSLEASAELRMYFTPYPLLFMTHESLEVILEDLLVEKRLRSYQADYKDRFTPEMAQQMYRHFKDLASDPTTTLGLSRNTAKLEDGD